MNLALNPFGKGKRPEKVDNIDCGLDEVLQECFKFYKGVCFGNHDVAYVYDVLERTKHIPVLNPNHIDIFLQMILKEVDTLFVEDLYTGLILTKLIESSHKEGNNDFYLHTGESRIMFIGYKLVGRPRLKLYIEGNAWHRMAEASENVDYVVTGDIGNSTCYKAKNCSFRLYSYLGFMYFPPRDTYGCKFYVKNELFFEQLKRNNRASEVYLL